jgi:hypothetical protein
MKQDYVKGNFSNINFEHNGDVVVRGKMNLQ